MQKSITPANKRIVLITVLCTAVLFYWISLYLYVPTLPIYIQGKVNNLNAVGVILSMYGLWQLVIRLPIGILSDWAGRRRPFILVTLSLIAGGALLMGRATSAVDLAVGRSLVGLGAGTWVPLVVLFTSLFPSTDVIRASGILMMMNTAGRMLATGVNGTLNQAGGYPLAFNLAAVAAGITFVIIFLYPEEKRPIHPPSARSLVQLFSRRAVIIPALLSALLHYGDYVTTFSFIPISARQLGASDNFISLVTSSNLLITLAGNLLISWVGHRIKVRYLLITGFMIQAAGIAGAAFSPTLIPLVISQLVIGLGFGISYPVLIGAGIQKVGPKEVTSAMGLHQSVYAIGMFAGPWLGGMLASSLGIQSMFGMTAVLIVLLAGVGIKLLESPPKSGREMNKG